MTTTPALAQERPVVAAASSLVGVLEQIKQSFEQDSDQQVRISFGSSGNLTRQIIQGAPFEVFLSADESYIATLVDRGLTEGSGDVYATGRLVLFIPNDSPLRIDPTLKDLANAMKDGRLGRLAIANPEHAPYGRAAREVLQHHQIWQSIQSKLLFGENIAQAAQFTVSGDVEAGILSYSIALEPALSTQGRYVLLPQSWHEPLHHYMVLLNNAGEVSRAFYAYLSQPTTRETLQKFGFSTPTNSQ
ncbi:MAG: molybdate ABC transporter substrate-binding protein [Arenicellales bacterium]|nr:molybdate ABC transporter substrate-binding protein [Arenicellales bacterium]